LDNDILSQYLQLRKCVYALAIELLKFIRGGIMSVKDAVANRFREICESRGIKANELANISGVTPSTVYSLLDERRRDVSVITIKKLCDGLDMTLREFFSTAEFDELEQEIK
jgi:DNA-binding Xre family transcriptional regulator